MNNSDKILAYLENTLSQPERASLEGEIRKDPNLKNELDFHTDIIRGIQQARKAELKAMLNNVPIGGNGFTSTLSGTHYISIALVTALVGTGIFYFWPEKVDNDASNISTPIEHVKPNTNYTDNGKDNEHISSELNITKDNISETDSPTEENKTVEEVSSESLERIDDNILSAEENLALVKPDINEGFDTNTEPEEIGLPENALLEKSDFESSLIVVRENKFKEFNYHYQFKDNSLILYGDFDDTYEILDLNKNGRRAMYLYYNGQYHTLNIDQVTILKLTILTDGALTTQLDNLRTEKGN